MRRRLFLCALLLGTLTACVVPNFYGPDFSKAPIHGATKQEVVNVWGNPYDCAHLYSGRDRLESCTWRTYYRLILGGGGSETIYDYRTIHFTNGQMIGGSGW